ncbi:hypothetical protein AA0121_g12972, partial [Alternaria tenuissima]
MFTPLSSQATLRNAFNQQGYREAVIGLLTRRRMPFQSVEWSEMKDLALACNPFIEDLLITSRRTAVRSIASNYSLYRGQIRDSLAAAISPIHLATDLWTSPHLHSLLAICAQWVDSQYVLQKALLGLPECRFTHAGEKQASLILEVLENFNIQSKIGWYIGDNATSNDTCLEHLQKSLLTKHEVKFDAKHRRIRCIGHIINLSLQAFLLASSKEALLAALNAAAEVSGEELLSQFSRVLNSQQQRLNAESQRQPGSRQSQVPQRPTRQRSSWGNPGSISDEFSGIQHIPALSKLHDLAVWLRNSTLHANIWDRDVDLR